LWSGHKVQFDLHIKKPMWQEWWFITLLLILFLLLTVFIIWKIYQERYKKVLLHDKLLESELKALTAQMNPHFIFNILNTVQRFFVTKEVLVANKLLSKFGTLMRNILDNTSKSFISIEDEIRFLRNYLEIEQTRFSNKFEFEIIVAENIDISSLIPSMIVQPFVENAIIHGVAPKEDVGIIKIIFETLDDTLKIVIDDDGVGRSNVENKMHVSHGIKLIKERLNILNSKNKTKYRLVIIDKKGTDLGTRVELFL
jgi:LytS/YehU family sensor histidine kinase